MSRSFLRKRGLIDEERVQLLLSWRHSGFCGPQLGGGPGRKEPAAVERLIRYVMRPPVALQRLQYDDAGVMEIRSRPGSDELVARVIAQVPGSVAVVNEIDRVRLGRLLVGYEPQPHRINCGEALRVGHRLTHRGG